MRPSLLALLILTIATPALAQRDKGDNPGHGRGGGPPPAVAPQGGGAPSGRSNVLVSDHDRNEVYSYYRTEHAAGNCPPGLAKKGNGCLPPGQAKKQWTMGQR